MGESLGGTTGDGDEEFGHSIMDIKLGHCKLLMFDLGMEYKYYCFRMSFRKYLKPIAKLAKSDGRLATKDMIKKQEVDQMKERNGVGYQPVAIQKKEIKCESEFTMNEAELILPVNQKTDCEQPQILLHYCHQQDPIKQQQQTNPPICPQSEQESPLMQEQLEKQPELTTQEALQMTIDTISRLQSLRNGRTEDFVTLTKSLRILQAKKPELHIPQPYAFSAPFDFPHSSLSFS